MIAIAALAAVLWWLSSTPPRWYQPPDALDAEAGELAALVEHRLAEEVHKIREDESPWRLRIRDEQINAWLATRLHRWLEHEQGVQWPAQLGTPQVRFDTGQISVAMPASLEPTKNDGSARSRPITVVLTPHLIEDELRFEVSGIRIGRLAVPGDPATQFGRLARVDSAMEQEGEGDFAAVVMQTLIGHSGISSRLTLADGRRVVLRDLRLGRAVLDVSVSTLPAERTHDE